MKNKSTLNSHVDMDNRNQGLPEKSLLFAVLIDADNISASYVSTIFDELDKYGFATCRRIYGNWSKNNSWNQDVLLEYSIIPVQQFSYTTGKNATDMAMVIDAMDLLYKDNVDAFCIVTSDSDFTRLAMRLREERKYVIGMGESKTPLALARACNKFVHLDLIGEEQNKEGDENSVTSIAQIEKAMLAIINGDDKKKVELGELGSRLAAKYPDFDVRNYGYSKLSVFVKEEIKSLKIQRDGHHNVLEKQGTLTKDAMEEEIVAILKKNKGQVDNLSVIYNELKKKYPDFDVKDYGFSRVSQFLRSIGRVSVTSNQVKLKK